MVIITGLRTEGGSEREGEGGVVDGGGGGGRWKGAGEGEVMNINKNGHYESTTRFVNGHYDWPLDR